MIRTIRSQSILTHKSRHENGVRYQDSVLQLVLLCNTRGGWGSEGVLVSGIKQQVLH